MMCENAKTSYLKKQINLCKLLTNVNVKKPLKTILLRCRMYKYGKEKGN